MVWYIQRAREKREGESDDDVSKRKRGNIKSSFFVDDEV
jgi:hypothetical protein